MKNVYACLLGEWVSLTNTPGSLVFERDPNLYYKEEISEMFDYDYVNVTYENKHYRIHPSLIQVVTE